MKALIVSHSDREGGAAIAAHRLLSGLNAGSVSARMLVARKLTQDSRVHVVAPSAESQRASASAENLFEHEIQRRLIDRNRSTRSDTLFSFPYPAMDISQIPILEDIAVVNLHWINGVLSPATIANLLQLDIPVVWTLHDMWPFTGGCHYSAGCEGFLESCDSCPQLDDDHYSIPSGILRDKLSCLEHPGLTVVAPSEWIQKEAQRSAIFKERRVELIPNALDTGIYNMGVRQTARQNLEIDEAALVLMFGAAHGRSKRKGFDLLLQAVEELLREHRSLAKELIVVSMGHPSPELSKLPVKVVNVGYKHEDAEIAEVYGAADIFVLPSREDNLPNTIMEAMACGCVPVAFDIGGTGEMFQNGVHGMLVTPFDTGLLAGAIRELIENPGLRKSMSNAGAERIGRDYNLDVQARRYASLFADLAGDSPGTFKSGMRERFVGRKAPYPSEAFAGEGGALYRRLLIDSYSIYANQLENTRTPTLGFIILRRIYRRLTSLKIGGAWLKSAGERLVQSRAYRVLRRRIPNSVGDTD